MRRSRLYAPSHFFLMSILVEYYTPTFRGFLFKCVIERAMGKKDTGHVLVCITEHPRNRALLYAGARKARELQIPWVVLHVETPDYYHLHPDAREHVLRCVTRAEEMGAQVIRVQATHVNDAIFSYVKDARDSNNPVRHAIIGAEEKTGFFAGLRPDHAANISAKLANICEVSLIPLRGEKEGFSLLSILSGGEQLRALELLYTLMAVLVALITSYALQKLLPDYTIHLQSQNLSMLFLICIMFVGGRWGLIPAMLAAFLSYFCVNYFYMKPYYFFTLTDAGDIINLMLFFMAAVMIALFSSRTRAYAQAAVKREKRTQALYQLQRLTLTDQTHFEALKTMHDALKNLLEMEVAFFIAENTAEKKDEGAVPAIAYPPSMELDEKSTDALRHCWQGAVTTGIGGIYANKSQWRFEPMFTPQGTIGVLGVNVPRTVAVDSSFGRLLTALADQAASILQRIALTRRMEDAKISEEKEKLRSLLLSSVSHDLKTPLASIIGSLSVYHSMFDKLSDEHKMTLTHTALDEAQRLDSFISNILDMTRLESGHIKFKSEWHDPVHLFKQVTKRMRNRLREREVVLVPPKENVEVCVDSVMTEQLFQNLIDNA
ncbi:MAG: DUF4118 domain-containing protein, partial [Alphaproteobacteria bacterium]|nr:DUF4118 domain-containing protein [Alphaproteobacteria bacterium]